MNHKFNICSDLKHLGFMKFIMITSDVAQIRPWEIFDKHHGKNKVKWANKQDEEKTTKQTNCIQYVYI